MDPGKQTKDENIGTVVLAETGNKKETEETKDHIE